jgi:hypothetical protein
LARAKVKGTGDTAAMAGRSFSSSCDCSAIVLVEMIRRVLRALAIAAPTLM